MNPILIGVLFRHVLSALGGAAIGSATTAPDPENVTLEMVGGAIATILAYVLSLWQKRTAAKTLEKAERAPAKEPLE